ncbi:hypothetical protein N7462_005350 [Penicillium macrosclerotiorum]|uniref:uncharacterized protein n=1 Tax=Penicillium macrosclerotiorum TaxID=303699 RepID=UPI002548541C|nr:uncharacterized protein N7462_005350 [Penicillium macrosclerotiorum]KAJ5682185.1 hypothetical protein N7462_005350 [Penicillium macrosclerotiorum]
MAAISMIERSQGSKLPLVVKRGNWASREPGVILVFCIVFVVAVGIIALFAYRKWMKRKAEKESFETAE